MTGYMFSNLKLSGSETERLNEQGVMSLTFSFGDGAANGGAGGGDGAHRRTHAIWGVHPSHCGCVGNPRCWVDRPDRLTYTVKLENRICRKCCWRISFEKKMAANSLLGRAKQLRGFGSQHLATVSVIGLEWKIEFGSFIWVQRKHYLCSTCSSPWLVNDVSKNSHCVVIAHVLEVNVVHLNK